MAEPKLRFKQDDGTDYPEWKQIALGDISTRITRKNSNNETDRPLTISSIEGLVDQRSYFGKTIASKDMSGYYLLKKGEFAYNKSYSVGYDYGSIKRLEKYEMGALSTLYICFTLNKTEISDFYNSYFNGLSWYNQMQAICAEGARNHGLLNVSSNDFFKIKLSVPSCKEEQQKIADFLSAVDKVIAESEKEAANLETQKKAVMKKIFSQEIRFKRNDGMDFPEWKNKTLGDLEGKVSSGKDKNENGCVPLYGSMGPIGTCSEATHLGNKILVARVGANAGAVRLVVEDCGVTDNTLIIKDTESCDFFWLYYALVEKDIGKMRFGGGQPLVTGTMLFTLEIEVPCFEEQKLIADFLSDFDEAIAAAKKELCLWKQLKKALLQQLFI